MRRLRVLRRLLVKYRAARKIDKHLYHELYHLSKGNTFKHKRALVEHVRRDHDIMTVSTPLWITDADNAILDPQGQGREAAREDLEGGDGCQACEDEGSEGEEAGACATEAGRFGGRGGAIDDWRHDKPAWAFLKVKEARISLLLGHMRSCFHVRLGLLQKRIFLSMHARLALRPHSQKCGAMNVHNNMVNGNALHLENDIGLPL